MARLSAWRCVSVLMLATPPALGATISASNDATALANALLGAGSGFTLLDAVYSGANGAAGLQTGGPASIGSGIILTTGQAIAAQPPQALKANTNNNAPGSAALTALFGAATSFDASILTLSLKAGATTTQGALSYLFGTEEPSGGVPFFDGFGAFITTNAFTGNIARDSMANLLRSDSFAAAPPGAELTTRYDRRTDTLTSFFALTPNEEFTISLHIADFGDGTIDSGVYLADLRDSSIPPPPPPPLPPPNLLLAPLDVDFAEAGGGVTTHDTVLPDSSTGVPPNSPGYLKEIAGGNPATALGKYLLDGEFINVEVADHELIIDLSLFDVSPGAGGGPISFSGWDPTLQLIGAVPLNLDNLGGNVPTISFTPDQFTFDWVSADAADPDRPFLVRYTLVFEEVPEPASVAILAAGLGWLVGRRRRRKA